MGLLLGFACMVKSKIVVGVSPLVCCLEIRGAGFIVGRMLKAPERAPHTFR